MYQAGDTPAWGPDLVCPISTSEDLWQWTRALGGTQTPPHLSRVPTQDSCPVSCTNERGTATFLGKEKKWPGTFLSGVGSQGRE